MLVTVTLTGAVGCSSGPAEPQRSATCDTLQAAVDDAQRQVEVAITDITGDPSAARDTVDGVRESLASASTDVSAAERDFVTRADEAVARLARQVRRSAAGDVVDGEVVGDVRTELLAVVQEVRTAC